MTISNGMRLQARGVHRFKDSHRRHINHFDDLGEVSVTEHFLEVLDELNHPNIEFVSLRENVDRSRAVAQIRARVFVGQIANF